MPLAKDRVQKVERRTVFKEIHKRKHESEIQKSTRHSSEV